MVAASGGTERAGALRRLNAPRAVHVRVGDDSAPSAVRRLGAWLGVTALVPLSVRFFLGFASDQMIPMISVSRYLGFVGSLTLACGLVAQTPLVIAVLAALGIVTPAFLWHHWRGAVLGSFVLAAVVTPTPDVFTQSLLAGVLLGLYGCSIVLAAVLRPRPGPSHGRVPRPMVYQAGGLP